MAKQAKHAKPEDREKLTYAKEVIDSLSENADDLKEDADQLGDAASTHIKHFEDRFAQAAESNQRFPKVLKVLGVAAILMGVLVAGIWALASFAYGLYWLAGSNELTLDLGPVTMALYIATGIFALANSICEIALGVFLLRNRHRGVAWMCKLMIACQLLSLAGNFMLFGLSSSLHFTIVNLIFLFCLQVYADPRLRHERAAARKSHALEDKADQEAGILGRDKSGKGYIELDFFNVFWIFVTCSFLGLVLEVIWHVTVVDPGVYQDRAGLLYGPFSPIYGVGGVLITVVLNRFYKSNPFVVFLVAGFIGAAFEFLVSYWMQYSFGIVAWDYHGTFLNIDGRTNFFFFCMWGLLGILWLRLALPQILRLITRIPWNLRYGLTTVCFGLMLVNAMLTVASFDCWYMRTSGNTSASESSALERFCDKNYPDAFMEKRFQSMDMDPSKAVRVDEDGGAAAGKASSASGSGSDAAASASGSGSDASADGSDG